MTILLKNTIQEPNLFKWATEASKTVLPFLQKVFQSEINLPDVIKRFASLRGTKQSPEVTRKRTDQSFLVPFKEIKDNDWDLSINRYKEIVYEEVEYDAPEIIIDRINQLSKDRENLLKTLSKDL